MLRSAKKKLALVGAFGMAGLLGCGLWNWAGVYSYSIGTVGATTTLSQPNPVTVNLSLDMYFDQFGHATCLFHVDSCTATVNMSDDSWHAPKCTIVSQANCIGYNAGDVFGADIDGKMVTQTSGTVDTYDLTVGDLGFGVITLTLAR